MIKKLLGALYLKVFVNIIVQRSTIVVYIEHCDGDNIVESSEKKFQTIYLTKAVEEFIGSHTNETPYFYISILDKSQLQGALPTCNPKEHAKHIELASHHIKCYNKSWSHYTQKSDLLLLQKEYTRIGLDYIFSPFVLLAEFYKEKIELYTGMYILVEDGFLSLSVFELGELLFSEHLDMLYKEESGELLLDDAMEDIGISFDTENSIDLDDLDAMEDLEDFDDFGDIEDLDDIEEIDEFSDDRELELLTATKENTLNTLDTTRGGGFNEDYQRFSMIQASVKHFYKNTKYKSVFIENVYIADAIGLSDDLKHYLEDEMFLNVHIKTISLAKEISVLAKKEQK